MVRTLSAAVLVACLAVSGCGKDKAAGKTTTTARPATTTTAASDTTVPVAADPGVVDAWRASAAEFRGQDGTRHTFQCPPGGTLSDVYGSESYTDDSPVCVAAVHMGLITVAKGGEVKVETTAGRDEYDAGVANGVTSVWYGPYAGSYTFPAVPAGSVAFALSPASWTRSASESRGKDGKRLELGCAPDGTISTVTGSGPYTDDSSICSAAVHAGLITAAEGGNVAVIVGPGEAQYTGSTANGVTTGDYGAYPGSFTFPSDQPTK